jgi:hypothetical protein
MKTKDIVSPGRWIRLERGEENTIFEGQPTYEVGESVVIVDPITFDSFVANILSEEYVDDDEDSEGSLIPPFYSYEIEVVK